MKIEKYEQINKQKFYRVAKPINPIMLGYFRNMGKVIEKERSDVELHQCNCGKLFFMPISDFDELRKKFKENEIPCPSCGKYEDRLHSADVLKNILSLTESLRKYEKSSNRDKKIILDDIQKQATEFISHDSIDEIYAGYSLLMKLISPTKKKNHRNKFHSKIKSLCKIAEKNNPVEFEKLVKKLESQHTVHDAMFDFFVNTGWFDFFDYVNKFFGIEIEGFAKDFPKEQYILINDLLRYNHLIELQWTYDCLYNLVIISKNGNIKKDFEVNKKQSNYVSVGNNLYQKNTTNITEKIKYPREKIDWLKKQPETQKIAEQLESALDSKLRNAIYHSSYKIQGKYIVLKNYRTKTNRDYKKTLINAFHKKLSKFEQFENSLTSIMSEYRLKQIRKKIKNPKSKSLFLAIIDDKKTNQKFLRVSFSIYWDILLSLDKGFTAKVKINLNKKTKDLKINFNGREFKGKATDEMVDYFSSGKFALAIDIIAPRLPVFNPLATGWVKTTNGKRLHIIGTLFVNDNKRNKEVIKKITKALTEYGI